MRKPRQRPAGVGFEQFTQLLGGFTRGLDQHAFIVMHGVLRRELCFVMVLEQRDCALGGGDADAGAQQRLVCDFEA